VTGVTLTAVLPLGQTLRLSPLITPADATNRNVSWSSGNPSAVTVTDGLITAVGPGSALITVTTADGNFRADFLITSDVPTGTVTATALNLRTDPNTGADIITSIPGGTTVYVLDTAAADGWYKIQTVDGQAGYASSQYITLR
jgi:uncharacterized protein YjdB